MKAIQRLQEILEFYKIPISHFERKIDVSANTIQASIKRNGSLKDSTINKTLDNFPDVNPLWLLRGEGSMFLDSEEQPKQSAGVEVSNYNSKIEQQQDYGGGRKAEDLIIKEKDARLAEKERHIAANERYIRILERQLARYEQAESLSN